MKRMGILTLVATLLLSGCGGGTGQTNLTSADELGTVDAAAVAASNQAVAEAVAGLTETQRDDFEAALEAELGEADSKAWYDGWVSRAQSLVNRIRNVRARDIVRRGLTGVLHGWVGDRVRDYYRGNGLYCPEAPRYVPGVLKSAWYVLTCAERCQ